MTDPAAISVSDFIGVHDTELYPLNLQSSIADLERDIGLATAAGTEPDPAVVAALDQLLAFWTEVHHLTNADPEQATIVPDDLFADWSREWAEASYDLPLDISNCVDWDQFGHCLRDGFQQTRFGPDLVWVK